jgi:hypothetical protein
MKVEIKRADIILKFSTENRASLELCIYDADSNDFLWRDYRSPSIVLHNDAARALLASKG